MVLRLGGGKKPKKEKIIYEVRVDGVSGDCYLAISQIEPAAFIIVGSHQREAAM